VNKLSPPKDPEDMILVSAYADVDLGYKLLPYCET